MRISFLFIILASFALLGCSHTPLQSPCGPTASIDDHPCGHIPVNIASISTLKFLPKKALS